MEEQKQVIDNTILGLQVSLSGDLTLDFGFVKSYNAKELFYIDCLVNDPEKIGNGICDAFEPYYTEQCGYDGGDCPLSSLAEGYDNCNVGDPYRQMKTMDLVGESV